MKTKAFYYFIFSTFLFISYSCEKNDEVTCISDCMKTYLEQNQMVSYKGEAIDCKYFLSLYEYENRQYYVLGNHCADVAGKPTDCNGKTLCESEDEKACSEFFKNAKYIGIVGVEE